MKKHFIDFIALLLTLLFAMIVSPVSRAADQQGGFVTQCAYQGANLTGDHFLGMYCLNDQVDIFGFNYTWIDLDYCVGNNGGQLVAWENGTYTGTCTNCTVAADLTLNLTCSCWDTENHHVVSTLDLNTTIFDVNGSAACYAQVGNKTWEQVPDGNSS